MFEKYGTKVEQKYMVKKAGSRLGETEIIQSDMTFDEALELADKHNDYKIYPQEQG